MECTDTGLLAALSESASTCASSSWSDTLALGLPKLEESCDSKASLVSGVHRSACKGLVAAASVDGELTGSVVLAGGCGKLLAVAEESVCDSMEADSPSMEGPLGDSSVGSVPVADSES